MYILVPRQAGSSRRPRLYVTERGCDVARPNYWQIWRKYRPRGYRITYDNNLRKAYSSKPDRRITCPRPTSAVRLCYALHEAMRVRLDPWTYPDATPLLMEYRTEHLTLAVLQAEGVPITEELLRHCRYNVRKYIEPGRTTPKAIATWLAGQPIGA